MMDALDHRSGTAGFHIYHGGENGKPNRVGPEPLENEVSLREQIADQIYGLFGISPRCFFQHRRRRAEFAGSKAPLPVAPPCAASCLDDGGGDRNEVDGARCRGCR